MMRYERIGANIVPGQRYNQSYDECLGVLRRQVVNGFLEVSIRRYANGPLKMQLSRIKILNGKECYVQFGRVAKDELAQLIELLHDADKKMQEVQDGDAVGCEAEPVKEAAS